MRDLIILFLHVILTSVRLARPGGIRSVIAESVLLKHQLLILNRSRQRAPNLQILDRLFAGFCSLFIPADTPDSYSDCAQTFDFAEFPSCTGPAKVSVIVL